MSGRELKNRLYEQFSKIGKAVSSPRRLELLEILAQGARTVEVLANETALSVANASHHLQALREACLVEARKEGLHVYYRLAEPDVYELSRIIRVLAERRLAEVDRIVRSYLTTRDGLEPVGREDLLERARAGTVLVIDVRPQEEFRAGHIPGAISVPVDELERHIGELPADKEGRHAAAVRSSRSGRDTPRAAQAHVRRPPRVARRRTAQRCSTGENGGQFR